MFYVNKKLKTALYICEGNKPAGKAGINLFEGQGLNAAKKKKSRVLTAN
jgi:hypothetical protein